MKRWFVQAALMFFFLSCSAGSRPITAYSFYSIPIGATKEEVVEQVGKPSRIRNQGGGVEEYEYIERLNAGARVLEMNHYILTLQEGKVISKRVERGSPPPTRFDSYDMQTTQKQ